MSADWEARDVNAAADIVASVGPVILSTVPGSSASLTAARLRNFVGDMIAAAATYIVDGTITTRTIIAITLARMAGATLVTLPRIRIAALAEEADGEVSTATRFMFVCVCLSQEAAALSVASYQSRDEASAAKAVMMAAFDQAAEIAADDLQQDVYMKLITLQGRTARQFYEIEMQLPRVSTYKTASTLPALVLSHRLYGDASRADELRAENGVIHPAFMPRSGKMLAV